MFVSAGFLRFVQLHRARAHRAHAQQPVVGRQVGAGQREADPAHGALRACQRAGVRVGRGEVGIASTRQHLLLGQRVARTAQHLERRREAERLREAVAVVHARGMRGKGGRSPHAEQQQQQQPRRERQAAQPVGKAGGIDRGNGSASGMNDKPAILTPGP